jgi:hypothetical protein
MVSGTSQAAGQVDVSTGVAVYSITYAASHLSWGPAIPAAGRGQPIHWFKLSTSLRHIVSAGAQFTRTLEISSPAG